MRTGTPLPRRGVEVWRTIVRSPEFAVSNRGRIKRITASSPEAVPALGRVKKLTVSDTGYQVVSLWSGGRGKSFQVHRLVCEGFHGSSPSKRHQTAHANGIRTDNHAFNLRWATPTENAADKEDHGTVVRGEAHPYSKLTAAAVAEIRNAAAGQCGRLAAKFGVERTHVSRIRNKRAGHWSHVPFPSEAAR